MNNSLQPLQMLLERIESEARKLAWADYYRSHDHESWDDPDKYPDWYDPDKYPDWYEPDEYRQKVIDKLFSGGFNG